MKTNLKNQSWLATKTHLVLVIALGLLTMGNGTAQYYVDPITKGKACEMKSHDYLMPGKGKSMVSLYTGVPYIGVGEFAYGISNRVSVSAFLGVTPVNYAFGSRIKAVLIETSGNFRINLKTTAIYYPFMKFGEGDSWALGWQAANAEWKLKNGSRLWAGAGILGVSCLDKLFPSEGGKKMMPKDPEEKEMEMDGVFNTFQFGYSKPLSSHTSLVIEVAPVMQGFKLKEKNGFLDAFPVIVTAGFTHTF